MYVRRLLAGALCVLFALAFASEGVRSATGDKQLARVKGVVGYQANDKAAFQPIFGRLDLPDDAIAVTQANASAVLRLRDSSEIDIGEKTTVQVGAFNAVTTGRQNELVLNNGALHFKIRHPEGGQSNYRFVTATSQIAVRGTEGFLLATADSTSLVCVSCAAGDVTAQVGSQTISVVSGQTLTVVGANPLTAAASVQASAPVGNGPLSQFSGASGAGGGIGGAGAAIGGGAAAVGGAVAATSNKTGDQNPNDQPSPGNGTPAPGASSNPGGGASPGPTSSSGPGGPGPSGSPTPNPLILNVSFPGANAVFPVAFAWQFSQLNAAGNATITGTPASVINCCTLQQTLTAGTLTGTASGQLVAPGTFTVNASAPGTQTVTGTFKVYGGVTFLPAQLDLTALNAPKTVTITQKPDGTPLTATSTCVAGAAITLAATSGTSPWTLQITGTSVPTVSGAAAACTVTVKGSGDGPAATATLPVTITSTGITITGHSRKHQ